MNKKTIVSGLIAFVLIFSNPLLLADGGKNDKDDDKDGGNNNNRPLVITAAEPDFDAGTLLITGRNFSRGAHFRGKVRLFFPPEFGSTKLTVIGFDSQNPQMIPDPTAPRL